MAADLVTIKRWFDHGKDLGATHMIVMCDTFDLTDYPVHVAPRQDPKDVAKSKQDRVMECYSYDVPWETQAAEHRANHWEMY